MDNSNNSYLTVKINECGHNLDRGYSHAVDWIEYSTCWVMGNIYNPLFYNATFQITMALATRNSMRNSYRPFYGFYRFYNLMAAY